MTLFKNKYRVETTRLQGWDYSGRGYYYITICTKDKKKLFGCLENNRVILSGAGFKALELWQRIPDEFLNIEIKEYVFMPEHMHALIKIKEEGGKSLSEVVGAYKSRSAKAIGLLAGVKWNEVWQKGFYDSIIKDEKHYFFVEEYIKKNPLVQDPENYYKEWFELPDTKP